MAVINDEIVEQIIDLAIKGPGVKSMKELTVLFPGVTLRDYKAAFDHIASLLRELMRLDAIEAALAQPKPPPCVKRSKTASKQLLLPLTKR